MPIESYIDNLISGTRRQPRRRVRRMPEDVHSSLIGRVGGSALSGLAAIGNVLDVPGSMVRDVVAGKNPLDQLLDPMGRHADQNRTSGRDVLRREGAIGSKDTWGNFAGGMATEIAMDPLTYLTLGSSALVKGAGTSGARAIGQAARNAGTLPKTLAGQIKGGHRGLVGLRAPFSSHVLPIGTGKTAQKIAGGLDFLGEGVRYSAPGRAMARILDAEVGGTTTTQVQKLAKDLAPQRRQAQADARLFAASKVDDLVRARLVEPKHGDALRRALEGVPAQSGDPVFDTRLIDEIRTENQQLLQKAQNLGMDVEEFRDSTNLGYFQRFLSAEGGTTKYRGRVLQTTDPSEIGRKWYMRDIEGGTDMIQRIARDADIEKMFEAGEKTAAIRNAITSKYGDVFKGNAERTAAEHGTSFVNSLKGMAPETRAAGVFGNHPMADMVAGMTSRRDAITVAQGINDFLPSVATTDIGPGMVPLKDVMGKLKMSKNPLAQLDLHIPEEIAEDLTRLHDGFKVPDSVNPIIDVVDRATNLFKAGVTGVWPAFHVRNLSSGQWQNWISGTFSPSSVTDAHSLMRGGTIKGAETIPIVAEELTKRGLPHTSKEGSKLLADLAYAHEIVGKYEGQAADVAGRAANPGVRTLDDITDLVPGAKPVGQPFQGGSSVNPLRVRGVMGEESAFHLAKWGENIGHYVEGLNRLSPFIHQLRKGVNPREAAERIGAAQVLYQNKYYTPFQSQFLARLMPFFKFTAGQVPFQLRMLSDQPGGKLAQSLRAINRGRNPDEITPDYVAETAAVGLGSQADGTQSYLTGFGLPIEDTAAFLTPDVRSVGLEMLSRTNPLVKAPLEYLTNQSFFQRGAMGGRSLDDLDPPMGRTVSNIGELLGGERQVRPDPVGSRLLEFVMSNSPASRAVTAARTATDPRKGIGSRVANLLSGFRVTDVSPAAQDAILRERAEQAMRGLGGRSFERMHIPDDVVATLPPDQQVEALRLRALLAELAQRTKERAASR